MVKKVVKKDSKVVEDTVDKSSSKKVFREPDTMKIAKERDIALDFGMKIYKEFDQMIKSVVRFGSSAKGTSTDDSDIDILIIIDDVTMNWDSELVAWYREELGKLVLKNPYRKSLHINTIKLTTWWRDLLRGDPVVLNVLRSGDALVDFGGFFNPLKILLSIGGIRATPEAIYTLLQRAPHHKARARQSMLAAVDGFYWSMIDSAHAVLIAADITPASPEDIPDILKEKFVKKKLLNKKYVSYYEEVHDIAKKIIHGNLNFVRGSQLDEIAKISEEFSEEMMSLVKVIIENRGENG